MQRFLMVAAALVVGMLAGYWQPAGEALRLRGELDQLRGQQCRSINPVRDFLRVEPDRPAPDRRPTADPSSASGGAPAGAPPGGPPADAPSDAPPGAAPEGGQIPDPFDPAQIDQAVAVMAARRAQALAALTEQAELDAEQRAEVERIFEEMDRTVQASIEGFVDEALESQTVQRRDALALGADLLDAAVVAEDRLWESLPQETMEGIDPETYNPINFVSGETIRTLSRLQDIPVDGL